MQEISPLEQFKKAFLPFAICEHDGGILYPFRDKEWADKAQEKADSLVMQKGLAVTTSVEEYCLLNGKTRTGLVVRPVPEEQAVADEAQDHENLTGGWWDKNEE